MEESREEFSWIEKIVDQYPRYKAEAYAFVMIVIDDIQESLEVRRHISGEVLLNGLKEYASSKYGPMAKEVLNSWRTTKSWLVRSRCICDFCSWFSSSEAYPNMLLIKNAPMIVLITNSQSGAMLETNNESMMMAMRYNGRKNVAASSAPRS